jgi:serpin B
MSMTVIIPDSMAAFTSTLDAATLAAIWKAEKKYAVTLTLPRFHANTHFDLSQVLQAMGMPTPFTSGAADFTGINADPSLALHIQKVIHQANIDVNEEGVTAAAATAVEGGKGSTGDAPTLPSVTVHVDHPFLFLIHDTTTGAVLFAGRMMDPSKT